MNVSRILSVIFVMAVLVPVTFVQADEDHPATQGCYALMEDVPTPVPDAPIPSIHIREPLDNAVINGTEFTISVETENFELANGHWHLYLDDTLYTMVYENQAFVETTPGTHRICAVLGDAIHEDLGIPDGIMVTVAEAAAPTEAAPTPAPAAAQSTDSGSSAGRVILVVVVGVILAAGGLWFGRRSSSKSA